MYKVYKNIFGQTSEKEIQRVSDNAVIPMDEANSDYQAYLKWVAEGNTPLPADE